jgi:dolichol kinase
MEFGLASLAQLPFWASQLAEVVILGSVAYGAGILATRYGVLVNYTRKIGHFAAFLVPVFVTDLFAFRATPATTLASGAVLLGLLGLLSKPGRSRSRILMTIFRSFDRPEDRPYTLLWLTTQLVAGYTVIITFGVVFSRMDMLRLIYIPILVSGIGDGLAEPVGVRFGRRKYQVPAIFSSRTYERTLEGSACVFVTSVAVILLFQSAFTTTQLWTALATVPLLLTLAEARAPHTWDQPFLLAAGYISLLAIKIWI